jgi:hypothetical protein
MAPLKKSKDHKFFLTKLAEDSAISLKPRKIGAIPKLAVLLGLLSPQFYEIYELCDGEINISDIASKLNQDLTQVRVYMDKLYKSKMIDF